MGIATAAGRDHVTLNAAERVHYGQRPGNTEQLSPAVERSMQSIVNFLRIAIGRIWPGFGAIGERQHIGGRVAIDAFRHIKHQVIVGQVLPGGGIARRCTDVVCHVGAQVIGPVMHRDIGKRVRPSVRIRLSGNVITTLVVAVHIAALGG